MIPESESVNTGIMNALNNRRRKNEKTGQPGGRDGKRLGLQGGLELRTGGSRRPEQEEAGFPRRQRQRALSMERESPESLN